MRAGAVRELGTPRDGVADVVASLRSGSTRVDGTRHRRFPHPSPAQ